MKASSNQNRWLVATAVIAVALGVTIGLLWAGSGSSATTAPSGNQLVSAANITPIMGGDIAMPITNTSNSGEAPSANHPATGQTPTIATPPLATAKAGSQPTTSSPQSKAPLHIGGVVVRVDAVANTVVLATSSGPLTATLGSGSTIQRQPLPGDDARVKTGPIAVGDLAVGSYAVVTVSRDQLPMPLGSGPKPTPAPISADAAVNRVIQAKQRFGINDGYNATASQLRVSPAPASIEESDRSRLTLPALAANFVALNADGTITATVSQFGNLKVVPGPGTRFDRLGLSIAATSLKPGDNLTLYGAYVWEGPNHIAATDVQYGSGLPVAIHIAALHLISPNEHVLEGKIAQVDAANNNFQITTTEAETLTVTASADTHYQSLARSVHINRLADLDPDLYVVVYASSDSDTNPSFYNANSVYVSLTPPSQ